MAKFYNARNDKVFKAIFADPSDTELLETLLNLTFNTKVKDIKFDNPELLKRNVFERAKTCVFVHIDYTYGLSEKLDSVLNYSIQTDNKIKYVNNVYLIEYNMDKIEKMWYNMIEDNKKKLFYYLSKFDMKEEELDKEENDAFVKKLKQKIKKLNQDKNFVSFISREDDIKFQMNTVRNEGKIAGAKEKSFEIAKNMLDQKINIDLIAKSTGLSKKEIENLQ